MGKEIFSQCRLTVSKEIKSLDVMLIQAVREIGFKITKTSSLIIEKDSTSREELIKLVNLLTSPDEFPERYNNTAITGAGSETYNKSRKQENGGAESENLNVLRSPHQETYTYDSRNRNDDTRRSSASDRSMSEERDVDQGVYTGHYSDIRVHIHKADITRLNVDCIVNAANTKLRHGGGVARVIAITAGKELQEACERFIAAGNTVPVTRVFVSPGGRLPAKHVFHAVGPIWDKYTDKNECTDDLKRTVLRCLVEAMRLRLSSIALPSISAAIFKVPKKLCAHSYMEAVKSFDAMFGQEKDCTLKEIHFVDIDDVMVSHVQESFMRHWGEPCDSAMERSLPPRRGAPSASQKPASPDTHTKSPLSYSALQAKSSGADSQTFEVETEYQIGRIRFCISNKPALSFDTDPILTIGKEFDKLSGTEDYKIKPNLMQCIDHHSQKNAFDFTYLCKPDGKQQRLLCRLCPEPRSPDDIKSAVNQLDVALRMSSLKGTVQRNVTSFVLTSRILYAEPNNKKQEEPSKSIVPKLVASLAHNVWEYLDTASQDRSSSLTRVVITASIDAIPYLCEVFESRDFVQKVWKSTVV